MYKLETGTLYPCSLNTKGDYKSTNNSFILSLRNKEELYPFKSMVLWPQFTIFGDSGKSSTFGAAWDIYIADHANSNMESYAFLGGNRVYELPDGVGINVNS